jgi:Cd2+/Zn2+-exporting ATPase
MHPIADAIVRAARDRGITVRPASDVRVTTGVGAEGYVDGHVISVGRVGNLDARAAAVLAEIENSGATPVALRCDDRLLALIGVADELRPDAARTLAVIRALGVNHTVMLTGDRRRVAQAIADQVGIETVKAELMPEDKSTAVAQAKASFGTVVMVGDGTNDAPALATADVAVVMGAAGTDVALEIADVALMADDLTRLPYTIALARRSRRIITQNITLSVAAIVALAIAAMAGAFTLTEGVFLNEAYALLIIGNGLRLLNGRPLRRYAAAVSQPRSAPPTTPVACSCAAGSCGCAPDSQLLTLPAPAHAQEDKACDCCAPTQSAPSTASGVANS